ncbi:GNAT family N-acetyltransferase [Listeria ilorinensis]|uniref:GNAT family N-acetyltransferase n=1 Tax=Listeria ilorinensis TaxID=2867439 RepID=UPI001EF4F615|nr:GNAT family N-acetyltransferase [Listeria ilorinensis]
MKIDDRLVFRAVGESDLAEVSALFSEGKDTFFATGKEKISIQDVASWLQTDDQFPYVLISGEKMIAYGEIWVDEEEGDLELAHLTVAKPARGQGYGETLLVHLLKEAERWHYPVVYLRVLPANYPAIALYRKHGFTEISPFDSTYNWFKWDKDMKRLEEK